MGLSLESKVTTSITKSLLIDYHYLKSSHEPSKPVSFGILVAETIELVELQMPEIDTSKVKRSLDYQ